MEINANGTLGVKGLFPCQDEYIKVHFPRISFNNFILNNKIAKGYHKSYHIIRPMLNYLNKNIVILELLKDDNGRCFYRE